jgi:raffinose/stachyose/melibiose transport system substrate-binding protein
VTAKVRRLALLASVVALIAAGCGGDSTATTTQAPGTTADTGSQTTAAPTTTAAPATTTTETMEPVTIEWWHIENNDPGLTLWQDIADEYMAMHPNVTINITVQENEAFKSALQTNLQAGDVPDIFQSWGGGGLREQVDAGLVQDITDLAAPWISQIEPGALSMMEIDGKLYGVPWDLGIVGMWYNKTLFAQAGIDAPPATWEELLADVQTFEDAGITPIALGAGDKWPAMFWYAYLALRIGGADVMQQAAVNQNFDDPAFLKAGEELQRLIALDPFQAGFLAAPWDGPDGQAAVFANGGAAMHLMGHWAPGTQRANGPDLAETGELGWFPFPAVETGAGDPKDAFGGGNGYAVGKDAPPEAVDFLKYFTSVDVARRVGATGTRLPVTIGSEDSITDPNLVDVIKGRGEAPYVQLYLDQAYPPEVGAAVNDVIQALFAGTGTPQDVVDAVDSAWK